MRLEKDSRKPARLARCSKYVASSPGTSASISTGVAAATTVGLDHSAIRMARFNSSRRCVGLCARVRACGSALGVVSLMGSGWLGDAVARASTAVRPWGDSTSGSSLAGWGGAWEGGGRGGSAKALRGGRRKSVEREDPGSFFSAGGDGGGLASRTEGSLIVM